MTHRLAPLGASLWLAGCSALAPPVAMPPRAAPPPDAPARWHAPLPHEARQVALQQWWQQFDDPLLLALIDAAQAASPTVAAAAARIAQARASRVAAGAALRPAAERQRVAARAGATRLGTPIGQQRSAGLQAELGARPVRRQPRRARRRRRRGCRAPQAGWHDARVAVAAEVANGLRDAARLRGPAGARPRLDARSRGETARLTDLSRARRASSRAGQRRAGARQRRAGAQPAAGQQRRAATCSSRRWWR